MSVRRGSRALLLSSLALALAPKCPVCLLAWVGLAGSAGLSWTALGVYESWLAPLTAASLALTALAVALQARGRRLAAVPAVVAALAGTAVYAGRFWLHEPALVYAGWAALAAAALLASRPRRAAAEDPCACRPAPHLAETPFKERTI